MNNLSLGYALSSEEHGPNDLVQFAKQAENAGFSFALLSDHYHPWLDTQGQSPFAFGVIGAISQVTTKIQLGTGVTCPILRYHPAIVAQMAATASLLMKGRFFLGLGTGENLNEHVVGLGWPPILVRQSMFKEAVEIIKLLLKGGYVNYYGEHYTIDEARVYSLPQTSLPLMIAAAGRRSAQMAGEIGNGLICVAPQKELVQAFENSGGKGKPKYAQITVCFDKDETKAKQTAYKFWANTALKGPLNTEYRLPSEFEKSVQMLTPDTVAKEVVCGPDVQKYIQEVKKYTDAGFDHIYFHQVGPDQESFFQFAKNTLLSSL